MRKQGKTGRKHDEAVIVRPPCVSPRSALCPQRKRYLTVNLLEILWRATINTKNVRTQVYSYLFFFEAKLPVRDIIPRGSSFQDFGENAAREEEIERKKKRKERRGRGGELPPWKSARKRRLDFTGLEPVGDTRLFLENVFEKTNKGKREGAKREREKNKRGNGLSKNLLVFSRGGFLNWKMKGKDFEVKVNEESYQLLLLLRRRLRCLSIRKSIVILSSIYTFYYSNDTKDFIKMDDKTMRPKYVYPRNKLPTAISIFNEKSFRRKNPIPPSKLISRADVNSIPAKR